MLVPNWSSFIFVVDVVVSVAQMFLFRGGCFRWRTFLEGAAGVPHPGNPDAGTVSVKKIFFMEKFSEFR